MGSISMVRAPAAEVTDKRLLRGARTRRLVLRAAVDIASAEGLEPLSFGRLAADTGLSKAGVQALFKTKDVLQQATVDHAAELFVEAVVEPASGAAPGLARLRALLEGWIAYVEAPVFRGGCFWVSTMAEQDSQPGPLRDTLARQRERWQARLARELRTAVELGEVGPLDPTLTAFQIDAVLVSVNTELRLGKKRAPDKARRVLESLLA